MDMEWLKQASGIADNVTIHRYAITYEQYSIFANDFVRCIKVVDTDDIYHEIGMLVCKSIEQIKNVFYTLEDGDEEAMRRRFIRYGYEEVYRNYWREKEVEHND